MTQYTLKPNALGRARVTSVTTPSGSGKVYINGVPTYGNPTAPGPGLLTGIGTTSTWAGPVQGTWVATGGSASTITNVNDASDASYVRKTSAVSTDFYTWNLGTSTIPSTEVVVRYKWRVRMKRPLATSKFSAYFFYDNDPAVISADLVVGKGSFSGAATTIAWLDGPWVTLPSPATSEMLQSAVNDINLVVIDSATTAAAATYFYEVEVVVETSARPKPNIISQGGAYNVITKQIATNVATLTTDVPHSIANGATIDVTDVDATFNGTYTVTGVTSNTLTYAKVAGNTGPTATTGYVRATGYVVTDSSRPSIGWVTTDADGDSQSGVDLYIYPEATITALGAAFTPGTSTPLWSYSSKDQGVVDTTVQRVVGVTLSQGAAYRAYLRTYSHPAVTGANPSATGGVASAWNYIKFTVLAAVPPTAQVTVTPDTTIGANRIVGTARVNLLTAVNAGFEDATTGQWAAVTNCSVTASTTLAKSGLYSLRLSSTAAGAMSASTAATGANAVTVTPGQSYSGAASFRAGATSRTCLVYLAFYDSTGTIIGSATNGTGVANATGSWTQATVTAVAPAKAATAVIGVQVSTPAAGAELHYVDEIALHPGSTPVYSPGGAQACTIAITATGMGNLLTTTTSALSTTSGTGAVIRSASRSKSGLSQRVKAVGATTVSTATGVGGIPMVAGATVTYSAKMTSESSTTLTMTIQPYAADGSSLATSSVAQAVTAGVMLEFTGTYTLPANTVFVALQFSTTVASDFYVDEMLLSYGSTTPAALGFAPARVRTRAVAVTVADGVFDYVDEGAPVDATPTVYSFDTVVDYGANASGPVSAVATINGTLQWSMRVLSTPERNVFGLKVQGELDEDRDEQVDVIWTLGSDYPTVLSGSLGGVDGTLEIHTDTDTEWRQIVDALTSQSTIVLHPNYAPSARGAEPKFIRVTKQRWKVRKYGARTYRECALDYVETQPF